VAGFIKHDRATIGRRTGCLRLVAVCALILAAMAILSSRSFAAAPATTAQDQALLVSGRTFRGQLIAAEEARLTFRLTSGDRAGLETIPTAQLVRWGHFVETSRGAQLLLVDGSLLVGELATIDREQIMIRSDLLGEVTLPAGSVLAILVHPPADPHRRDQLAGRVVPENRPATDDDAPRAAANDRANLDRVILDNGDQLDGSLTRWHDEMLAIETDAGPVELEAERVTAIQFRQPPNHDSRLAGRRVLVVGLADGSRLCAGSLLADAAKADLKLAGPLPTESAQNAVAAPIALKGATSAIVALQPLGGEAIYLSDLEPASYKHIPFLQLTWPYRSDRSAQGDMLRAGGKLFLKGLGMHSASRLTYDLDRPASRLEAALAIDDRAGQRGSVVFRVFVDTGDGHWEPRFTSPPIRGGDPAVPITVDVAKAKRISLLVEFADRGDELDEADWLDARLIP
jgi:NPCBM/NEW2 domain-containing protein